MDGFGSNSASKGTQMGILQPGAMLRETYEVERFLGEGAFAEVYRVKHRFLGRQALKVMKRTGMSMADIQEMLGEAILLSRIGHPNIVRVFDANVFDTETGPCGYFTMEYVAGGSLQKFWQSFGADLIPVATVLDLIKQVCRGLALAHNESPPIVHRDIKPQNILVGYEAEGLRARVSDFRLAKAVNPLTLLATTAGTVEFKPPEAFAERQGDSCASDVWAIGATLYMLLTDKLPFDRAAVSADAPPRTTALLVPPSRINPNVTTKSRPCARAGAQARLTGAIPRIPRSFSRRLRLRRPQNYRRGPHGRLPTGGRRRPSATTQEPTRKRQSDSPRRHSIADEPAGSQRPRTSWRSPSTSHLRFVTSTRKQSSYGAAE